jgi:hypothetical protein
MMRVFCTEMWCLFKHLCLYIHHIFRDIDINIYIYKRIYVYTHLNIYVYINPYRYISAYTNTIKSPLDPLLCFMYVYIYVNI